MGLWWRGVWGSMLWFGACRIRWTGLGSHTLRADGGGLYEGFFFSLSISTSILSLASFTPTVVLQLINELQYDQKNLCKTHIWSLLSPSIKFSIVFGLLPQMLKIIQWSSPCLWLQFPFLPLTSSLCALVTLPLKLSNAPQALLPQGFAYAVPCA